MSKAISKKGISWQAKGFWLCISSVLVLSATANAQIVIPPPPPPPLPLEKPAAPSNQDTQTSVNTSSRAYLLFEGELGDKASGEGVVILGENSGGPLSLDLLETLGTTDLNLQSDTNMVSEVLDESEAARVFRARRAALTDLLKRDPAISLEVALVRALDKVTGEVSELEVRVNEPVRFGTLNIVARTCQKSPPSEPPERAAFLQITDLGHAKKQPETQVQPITTPNYAFSGWMFASNPSVSAMDHAVYDVWVVDCKKA
ncbi:MAG: DUF2155 domain-containing protein [Alphaproteobacteria bacterium]